VAEEGHCGPTNLIGTGDKVGDVFLVQLYSREKYDHEKSKKEA
jgi:hypothetical protein